MFIQKRTTGTMEIIKPVDYYYYYFCTFTATRPRVKGRVRGKGGVEVCALVIARPLRGDGVGGGGGGGDGFDAGHGVGGRFGVTKKCGLFPLWCGADGRTSSPFSRIIL